jgi:hypothetical protein
MLSLMAKQGRVLTKNQIRCVETRPIFHESRSIPVKAGKRTRFTIWLKAEPEQVQE